MKPTKRTKAGGFTTRHSHYRKTKKRGRVPVITHLMRVPVKRLSPLNYYKQLGRAAGYGGVVFIPSKGFFDHKKRIVFLNRREIKNKLEGCFVKNHEIGHAMYGESQGMANKHALDQCKQAGFKENAVKAYMSAHGYSL